MKLKHTSKTLEDYTFKVLYEPRDVIQIVKKLHILGHGIQRGLTPSQHYWRVLGSVLGKQHLLGVFDSTGTCVGATSFYPEAVEDSHYVEPVLYTDFMVLEPGHSSAMPSMISQLHKIARGFGAGRLAISRGESQNTYKTTYHKVRSA